MSSLGYLMYLRISTEKQEEGYGLDKQERDCTTYAERNSFPVIAPPITDTITGDSSSREGLDKVLSILRAGKAKGVIIPSADRLARKTWIGIQALEQIHKANREVK